MLLMDRGQGSASGAADGQRTASGAADGQRTGPSVWCC